MIYVKKAKNRNKIIFFSICQLMKWNVYKEQRTIDDKKQQSISWFIFYMINEMLKLLKRCIVICIVSVFDLNKIFSA